MDCLINKQYENFDYTSRYTHVPYYYNGNDQKEIYGLGSNLDKTTSYVTHTVIGSDTLDYLALKYYADPTLWWVIAYYNDIQDSFIKLSDYYTTIKIPTISSIEFGAER